MKLTKLQRYTAYCIMLEEAEQVVKGRVIAHNKLISNINMIEFGLCLLFFQVFGVYPSSDCLIQEGGVYFMDVMPELFYKKPRNAYHFWFRENEDGWNRRIKLLKQCIEETHPDNPKNKL